MSNDSKLEYWDIFHPSFPSGCVSDRQLSVPAPPGQLARDRDIRVSRLRFTGRMVTLVAKVHCKLTRKILSVTPLTTAALVGVRVTA
jgi:hypothetical protein